MGEAVMYVIKSPLKYFPIQIGDYKLLFHEKFNSFSLLEKNNSWMGYDQNSFWQSSEFYIEIERAFGVCVTTGLGLGILQSNLMLKDNVSKVIVYEKSKDLIEIFNEIVKFNNFDISKLEIRQGNADEISNVNCDCLFADHFDNEPQEHIINVVKSLSEKNNANLVWFWPAGNYLIKFVNRQNKDLDNSSYELWKQYTGIKKLPTDFSDDIFAYLKHLQNVYTKDLPDGNKLKSGIDLSVMRKNMLEQSKKMR